MPLLCQGCLSPLVYLLGQRVNLYQKPQWEKQVRQWFQNIFVCQLLSELLHDKYLSLPNDNHLYCVTSEHTRGQLSRKEKAAFFIKYPFVYPKCTDLSATMNPLAHLLLLWTYWRICYYKSTYSSVLGTYWFIAPTNLLLHLLLQTYFPNCYWEPTGLPVTINLFTHLLLWT